MGVKKLGGAATILVTLVGLLLLLFISVPTVGVKLGFWTNETKEISDKYAVQITPSDWAFAIWPIIYTYQLAWVCYGTSTIFRKSKDGYLYYTPPYMPTKIYICYIVNLFTNAGWLLTWNNEYVGVALVDFVILTLTLYLCLAWSFKAIRENRDALEAQGKGREVTLVQALVQNGIATYATWTTIAVLVNFAVVLVYRAGVDQTTAAVANLSILTIQYIGWVVLDIFVLDQYTRYLITPYLVTPWALAGVLTKNWSPNSPSAQFSLLLLGLSGFGLLFKIAIIGKRWATREPVKEKTQKETLTEEVANKPPAQEGTTLKKRI